MFVSTLLERFSVKVLCGCALFVAIVTNIPTALVTPGTNYWAVSRLNLSWDLQTDEFLPVVDIRNLCTRRSLYFSCL